jgi:hypothetical protein
LSIAIEKRLADNALMKQNRTKEWNEKISASLKGHKLSVKTRQKIAMAHLGVKAGMTGKKHSAETRARISESRKGKAKGEKNGFWNGGTSKEYKEGYYSTEYKRWRMAVFERDHYTCQVCRKVGGYLTAHHVKSWANHPQLRFTVSNGITLCEPCHSLTDNYRGRNRGKNL